MGRHFQRHLFAAEQLVEAQAKGRPPSCLLHSKEQTIVIVELSSSPMRRLKQGREHSPIQLPTFHRHQLGPWVQFFQQAASSLGKLFAQTLAEPQFIGSSWRLLLLFLLLFL